MHVLQLWRAERDVPTYHTRPCKLLVFFGFFGSRNVYCAQGANDQCFMSSKTPDLWRDATVNIIKKGELPDSLIFDSKLANLAGTEGNGHVKYWKQFQVWRIFVTSRPFWLYDLTLRTLLGI